MKLIISKTGKYKFKSTIIRTQELDPKYIVVNMADVIRVLESHPDLKDILTELSEVAHPDMGI